MYIDEAHTALDIFRFAAFFREFDRYLLKLINFDNFLAKKCPFFTGQNFARSKTTLFKSCEVAENRVPFFLVLASMQRY